MTQHIDYYDVFKTKLCNEIEPDNFGTGGGSMDCPAQSVPTNIEYIKKNLFFLKESKIKIDEVILGFYNQIVCMEISYRPNIKFFDTPITLLPKDEENFPDAFGNTRESICHDRPSLRGSMNIPQLEQLINGQDGKKWEDILWFEHMDDDIKKEWQKYLLFDYSVPECGVLLKMENNRIEDRLYFYYMDNEEPIDLGIGIEKYLMMAYKVKAFNGWQFALAKHPSDGGLTLKRMKHYLPQIFPKLEFDFSDFAD